MTSMIESKISGEKIAIKSVEAVLSSGKVTIEKGMDLYYPSHGCGKVVSIYKQEFLGEEVIFCQMNFKETNMNLLIPINEKTKKTGFRTIISKNGAKKILDTVLNKPAKSSRGVWSKRIQEYQEKLDSGITIFIAEVVRDLFPGMKEENKSFGERTLFGMALDCLIQEMSIALDCTIEETNKMIMEILEANCKKHLADKAKVSDGDFDDNYFDEAYDDKENNDDYNDDEEDNDDDRRLKSKKKRA